MAPTNVLMGLGFPEIVTSSSFVYSTLRDVCFWSVSAMSVTYFCHIASPESKWKKKSVYIFKMLEISFRLTLWKSSVKTKSPFYCIFLIFLCSWRINVVFNSFFFFFGSKTLFDIVAYREVSETFSLAQHVNSLVNSLQAGLVEPLRYAMAMRYRDLRKSVGRLRWHCAFQFSVFAT